MVRFGISEIIFMYLPTYVWIYVLIYVRKGQMIN